MEASNHTAEPRHDSARRPSLLEWLPWEKLLIWGLFLGAVYLLRHFFFIMLMTFLISMAMRRVILRVTRLISPSKERPWLERTVAVLGFLVLLVGMGAAANFVVPRLFRQSQELVGRIGRFDPEQELQRMLQETVGAVLFQNRYGGRDDPRYREEFEKFRSEGLEGLAAYRDFQNLESMLEGGFEATFQLEEANKIRSELSRSGSIKEEFEAWRAKRRQSKPAAKADDARKGLDAASARAAEPAREDLARLEREWREELVQKRVAELRHSPEYDKQFEKYYESRRRENPTGIPYDFESYVRLREAYPEGLKRFAQVLATVGPPDRHPVPERLHLDFQAARQLELAENWWEESAIALSVRKHLSDHLQGWTAWLGASAQDLVAYVLAIPVQLGTAILLSFFIVVDFPNLKRGLERLRDSRIRGFYDEIAPGVIAFGRLIGLSFYAQTIVSIFNTALIFLSLVVLGIEHAAVLSAVVFVCCFIPVFGVILSGIPIVLVAVMQPGGSVVLALKAVAAILVVHLIETSVIDPRVYGKAMNVHPVLILVVLVISEYFFGLWGLILGLPVAVYVLSVIMGQEAQAPEAFSAAPAAADLVKDGAGSTENQPRSPGAGADAG